jgi:hypothetical protein
MKEMAYGDFVLPRVLRVGFLPKQPPKVPGQGMKQEPVPRCRRAVAALEDFVDDRFGVHEGRLSIQRVDVSPLKSTGGCRIRRYW